MKDTMEAALQTKEKAKSALAEERGRLAQIESDVKSLTEVQVNAEKAYQQAENNLLVGVNRLPPAYSANVLGLQRVSEAMSQAAKTFMPARAEMDIFEQLLDELCQQLDDKAAVKIVLEIVATINVHANDEDVSTLIILKQLGEANLNEFLLPAVDPGAASISFGSPDDDELQPSAQRRKKVAAAIEAQPTPQQVD